jgi:hypothetical protein
MAMDMAARTGLAVPALTVYLADTKHSVRPGRSGSAWCLGDAAGLDEGVQDQVPQLGSESQPGWAGADDQDVATAVVVWRRRWCHVLTVRSTSLLHQTSIGARTGNSARYG